jgi:hypothetical protein
MLRLPPRLRPWSPTVLAISVPVAIASSASGVPHAPQPTSADPAITRLREEARTAQACADRRNPVEIYAPKPEYSASLRTRRLQGVVVTEGIILMDGSVAEIPVLKADHPDLASQACLTLRSSGLASLAAELDIVRPHQRSF